MQYTKLEYGSGVVGGAEGVAGSLK